VNTIATQAPAAAETADDAPSFDHAATYSPEDNKIRIYPAHRLDADTYARVRAAGYIWAPKQEIFVAPMWTPAREDLARELCGEIGDEDKTLAERTEERAERFGEYSEARASDAGRARDQVARIADGIPFGQPILVGHHSERHARKHAAQIESGMRRAVDMWETAEYWTRRAAGAIRAAKYKERADVRARRIKTIEADARKVERTNAEAAEQLRRWGIVAKACAEGKPNARELALHVANVGGYYPLCFPLADFPRDPPASQYEGMMGLWAALDGGIITAAQAAEIGQRVAGQGTGHRARWAAHYAHRIAYERAMLAEGGGLVAERFDLLPGGVITHRGRRSVILRVNRKDGAALSVTVTGQGWTVGVEEITAYEPPTETAAAAVAAVTKVKPLCNYDGGEGFARMTEAAYKALYEGSRMIRPQKATETHEAHRLRYISGYLSAQHGGPKAVSYDIVPVFLTDAKVKPAPVIGGEPVKPKRKSTARKIAESAGIDTSGTPETDEGTAEANAYMGAKADARAVLAELTAPGPAECAAQVDRVQAATAAQAERKADAAPFEAMRQALKTGQAVQVVSAPQLFPTPAHVAARMVDLARIEPGDRVLEPSAGTGALLRAIGAAPFAFPRVTAVEIDPTLAQSLRQQWPAVEVLRQDFLSADRPLPSFDVVLMNPPFANAADVRHILHARRFLAPGGRLVAVCAAGPRQHEALQGLADSWEYLPPGTFEGTNVRTVLLTMRAA
jgi:phospholipid N-methyltransferase